MATITYTDKVALNENSSIADINKVTDSDMNSIKNVVNGTIIGGLGLQTDNWISGGTYNVGDLVIDDNKLYKNITGTNTNTAPNQDSTNWILIPIITDGKISPSLTDGKLLWANSNPTTDISTANITLNSNNYDMLEIIYLLFNNNNFYDSVKVLKGGSARLVVHSASTFNYRNVTYNSDTSYTIGTNTSSAGNAIPVYVIGYKTDLF